VLFFTPDREHPDRPGRIDLRAGNLARAAGALRYRLEPTRVALDDGHVAEVPVFALDPGVVHLSLDEALGPAELATARAEPEEFLRDLLADGPVMGRRGRATGRGGG
jgi:hypothetical protein